MFLVFSNVFVLADDQDLQRQARKMVLSLLAADWIGPDALTTLPLLTSIIFEMLGFYPPLSQIMNKRTARSVMPGEDILLRAGMYRDYNGGAVVDESRPSWWGETVDNMGVLFRRATIKAAFITFHDGKRQADVPRPEVGVRGTA